MQKVLEPFVVTDKTRLLAYYERHVCSDDASSVQKTRPQVSMFELNVQALALNIPGLTAGGNISHSSILGDLGLVLNCRPHTYCFRAVMQSLQVVHA